MIRPYILSSIERTLKRSENLYNAGDGPQGLYFIEKGLVGLFHVSEKGKETLLRIFSGGNILGYPSYFAEELYHGTSVALFQTKSAIISKEQCQDICDGSPQLLKKITQLIARDLKAVELRLCWLLRNSSDPVDVFI